MPSFAFLHEVDSAQGSVRNLFISQIHTKKNSIKLCACTGGNEYYFESYRFHKQPGQLSDQATGYTVLASNPGTAKKFIEN